MERLSHACKSIFLAPRIIIKFVASAYMYNDADIVREMWVKGDLKDRLGIKHRRDLTRTKDIERAPMFLKPHSRSPSEYSAHQDGYEPALTHSPGELALSPPTRSDTLMDTPPAPVTPYHDETPREDAMEDPYAQPQYIITKAETIRGDDEDNGLATPPLSRNASARHLMSPSPALSYYSVSDVPVPSPMPQPIYRHPSAPYVPHAYSSQPPSRSNSVSNTLQIPSNAYEMRVRTPPQTYSQSLYQQPQSQTRSDHLPPPENFQRGRPPDVEQIPAPAPAPAPRREISDMTEASYATARQGSGGDMDAESDYDYEARTINEDVDGNGDWRASTYSYQGPRAM